MAVYHFMNKSQLAPLSIFTYVIWMAEDNFLPFGMFYPLWHTAAVWTMMSTEK